MHDFKASLLSPGASPASDISARMDCSHRDWQAEITTQRAAQNAQSSPWLTPTEYSAAFRCPLKV